VPQALLTRPRRAAPLRQPSTPSLASNIILGSPESQQSVQEGEGEAAPSEDASSRSQTPFPSPATAPRPASRLEDTQAAQASLQDRFLSLAALPTSFKPLPPATAAAFSSAATRLAEAFLLDPSDATLLDFLALPKVGLVPGLRAGQNVKRRLERFPAVDWPLPDTGERPAGSRHALTAAKQVESGRLGSAARILAGQTALAAVNEQVVDSLRSKHPPGAPDPFGPLPGPRSASIPSEDELMAAFKSFKPDTAPGISGWTHHLLAIALRSPSVLKAIRTLTGLIQAGTAPGQPFLCASRLIPLQKPDGGLRPIAVGDIIYRLASKAILRHSFRPDWLLPLQFGVGTKGGVEPVIRAVQRALDSSLPQPFTHIASLDFSNAFNTVSRQDIAQATRQHAPGIYRAAKWAYNRPTALVLAGGRWQLQSSEGVRQGDPLGPLLFSIGIRGLLARLATSLGPDHLVLAYLDDIYILGGQDCLERAQELLEAAQPSISLNLAKSKLISLDRARQEGLEVLGTCLGPTAARERFLAAKIEQEEALLDRLSALPHQHALLLLRTSIQQNLRHLQRSLPSDDLKHLWKRLDASLAAAVNRIRSAPSPPQSDALLALPIRMGGLGILSFETCAPEAFAAASEQSDLLLAPLLQIELSEVPEPLSQHDRCQKKFLEARDALLDTLNRSERSAVLENASLLGRKWLSIIPFNSSLKITDSELSAALCLRTLVPERSGHCRHCGAASSFNHGEVCALRGPWMLWRHEAVKNAIGSALGSLKGITARLEPPTHGTTRRNDISIVSRSGPIRSEEFDISITSLASQTALEATVAPGATEDATALSTAALLANKHLDSIARAKNRFEPALSAPRPSQHRPFTPLVFSVGGLMEKGTRDALKLWKSVMAGGSYSYMVRRVSLALLRARVANYDL
jgi:hypothetical protein